MKHTSSSSNTFTVTITSVAYGGNGIGHRDGKVIFVPDTLPGDRARVTLVKEKKQHSTARVLEILEPSPDRRPAEPGFLVPRSTIPYSPGYCYYYTDYANEVALKQQQFTELLEKADVLDSGTVLPPVASPRATGYRNKIKLHVEDDHGTIHLGYIMANNTTVLDLPACPLAAPAINAQLAELNSQQGFRHSLRQGMELTLRHTEHNGAVFWRNAPPKNMTWLREETSIGTISVPAASFFQVNIPVCNLLLDAIGTYLDRIAPEVVLDFFCGIGLFSIAAATRGIDLTVGIDLDPLAISAAEYNGRQHDLKNCQFIAGDAGRHATDILAKHPPSSTCLIIDPPRTGMDTTCRQLVASSGIKDILYVSCSADTLVRDLDHLITNGYRLMETQLLDMFPRTAHFEMLTHLTRITGK